MQKIDSVDGVLENFPNVKLSYEEFIHKKVSDADIILAIPQGKKCYIWFTTLKKQYVCYCCWTSTVCRAVPQWPNMNLQTA